MQFVKPIAVIHTAHNLKGGLQLAEFAGRLCYKSEGKAGPGTYVKFLEMIIEKGHTSVLEHCPIYICGYEDEIDNIIKLVKSSYFSRVVYDKFDTCPNIDFYYIYTNLRVIYDIDSSLAVDIIRTSTIDGNEIWNAHGAKWFEPRRDHPYARMSAYITTLRSIVDELVRERNQSMSVESTRWCDYTNDRFSGVTFCLPHWVNSDIFDVCFKKFLNDVKLIDKKEDDIERAYDLEDIAFCLYQNETDINKKRAFHYIRACILDEIFYNEAKDELELPAQDAREYLFLSVKSEIYFTCYNSEWDKIIEKRLNDKYGKAHENMHVIMKQCKNHLDCIRDYSNEQQDDKSGSK